MLKFIQNFVAACAGLVMITLANASDDPAIARTSQQVDMLDTLYKSTIILVTDKYVSDPSKFSGASAAKALFDTMRAEGFHEVRLVGLTDVLINPAINRPKDDFEIEAKKRLLNGAPTYEEVISIDGKRFLRKATAVPVVLEKCAMCHANFKDNDGVIGSLMFTVPVLE